MANTSIRTGILTSLAVILILTISSAAANPPAFSVGVANDAPRITVPTLIATAPGTYPAFNGVSPTYICAAAMSVSAEYWGGRWWAGDVMGTSGYFTKPTQSAAGYTWSGAMWTNTTAWSWKQNSNGCQATQQGDLGVSNLNSQVVGPLLLATIAVNAPLVQAPGGSQYTEGYSWNPVTGGGNYFQTGSKSYTYSVPSSSSGDFVVITIECSSYQCTSISVPSGCTLYGTYTNGWSGNDDFGYPFYDSSGAPAINVYTCLSVPQGSYTASATPIPTWYYDSQPLWPYPDGWCSQVESYQQGSNCFNAEMYISAYVFPESSTSALNTPVLSMWPVPVPGWQNWDSGHMFDIQFTISNIGGGTPPYTIYVKQAYTATNQLVSPSGGGSYTIDHTSASSITTVWPVQGETSQYPYLAISGPLYFAAEVVDSAGAMAFSKTPNQGPVTIYPPITPAAIISNPAFPSIGSVGDKISITDSWLGGVPPYSAVLTVSNSVTNTVISTQSIGGIPGAVIPANLPYGSGNTTMGTATFQFSPTISMIGNTLHANVTITDSAATPMVQNSIYSGILSISDNVLIVTAGTGDSTSISSIDSYEQALQNQGLTSLYVELDSSYYTQVTGLSNPNINDWTSVKAAINALERKTGAQYVVILGDATIVPMPTAKPFGAVIPTDEKELKMTGPALISTDDPYGTLTPSGSPSIIVARMPGSTGGEIGGMLLNAVNARKQANTNMRIFTDISTKPFSTLAGADAFARTANVATCSGGSPNCLESPPYCTQNPDGTPCASIGGLTNAMQSPGVQFYNCHGSGYTCGGGTANSPLLLVSWKMPTLSTNPVIITDACYGADIPGTYIYTALANADGLTLDTKTIAVSMLDAGASAYIGSTEVSLANSRTLRPPSSITIDAVIDASLYNKFKSGQTLGQAFLNEKIYFERSSVSTEGELIDQGVEMELYGDPTLTYSGAG
ncbi:MAG: hypothetical protein KGH94_04750 [Candidatus Micrarchaeota archaeon]|nr:hypothetical protein [Candidatus Micrarchaeota archaeon]